MLAGLLGREMAALAGALRARQGGLGEQQVGATGELDERLRGLAVRAVDEPARRRSLEVTAIAKVSTKCGTSWNSKRSGPTSGVDDSSYSSSSKAFSMRSSLPHAPTTRRKTLARSGRGDQPGRAGLSVPGQMCTGTGCWRGA